MTDQAQDTPETEDVLEASARTVLLQGGQIIDAIPAEFARRLEHERDEARAEVARLKVPGDVSGMELMMRNAPDIGSVIERLKAQLAERDAEIAALKGHAREVERDIAASVVKSAELEAENSRLRSALEIVHFKREPWQ